MRYHHLVVVLDDKIAECFEDTSYSAHAKGMQLRGAQCAHTGRSIDMNATGKCIKYLLMPNSRDLLEESINDSNMIARTGTTGDQCVEIAHGDGRQIHSIQARLRLDAWQGRT